MNEDLIHRIPNARSIAVLTGAGISAASGVPTFRGRDGLWKNFRPEELANFSAFHNNPLLVWEWYLWRRDLIAKVKPNAAHYALVDLEKISKDFSLITQNVDNLHNLAGSQNIIELHGNIMRNKCSQCNKPYPEEINLEKGVPSCNECGGTIRPDVVWFGEFLPQDAIQKAYNIAQNSEIFIIVGTSGVVEPAASLPFIAKQNRALLIEINPEQTPITAISDLFFQDSADKVLPRIIMEIQ
jgi:NAD-dependent deacetylase